MLGHYLMFNGNCAEALKLYERAFGVKTTVLETYGGIPNPGFPVPEERKNLVLHAAISLAGGELLCADSSEPCERGDNMYISITGEDAACVQRAWDALAEGADVHMALQQTFFAALHGSLKDRFGVNWMFTVEK